MQPLILLSARPCLGPMDSLYTGSGVPAVRISPKIATDAARHIAIASYLDYQRMQLAGALLDADHRVVAALLSQVSSAAVKRKGVQKAGRILRDRDRYLWGQVLARFKQIEEDRNRLAHHLWCYSKEHPGKLVLLDANHVLLRKSDGDEAASFLSADAMRRGPLEIRAIDHSRAVLYSEDELNYMVGTALWAYNLASPLRRFLEGRDGADDAREALIGKLKEPPTRSPSHRF